MIELFDKKTKQTMDVEAEVEPTDADGGAVERRSMTEEALNNFGMYKSNAKSTLDEPQNLALEHVDGNYVDPLFHKISGKFDDGGYKGLLLNNIEVDEGLHYVLYNERVLESKMTSKNTEDIYGSNLMLLRAEIEDLAYGLRDQALCPELATFRELFRQENNNMCVDDSIFSVALETSKISINDNVSMLDDMEDLGQTLIEEINNTQTPIIDEYEEYPVKVADDDYTYNNTASKFSTEPEVEYIAEDGNESAPAKEIFRENFDFWNYLEPESWQMSELSRAAQDSQEEGDAQGARGR